MNAIPHGSSVDGMVGRILAVHEMLDSLHVPHQFGGAIALAWYRSPRATADIDLNVTMHPNDMGPVLGALRHLGVTVSATNERAIIHDGQARLDWDGSYLDLFCATLDIHQDMAAHSRQVQFGRVKIPILSPEHLIVCKAIFNRPKDWVDIEEILSWGTQVDGAEVLRWVDEMLGAGSPERVRLAELLGVTRAGALPA